MNGGRHRCRIGISPSGGTSVRSSMPGQVAGEPAGDDHPPRRRPSSPGRRRVGRPRDSRFDRDGVRFDRVEIGDEPREQPGGSARLWPSSRRSRRYSGRCAASALMAGSRPGLGDLAQPAEIDLGVDRGGGQVAVSQHLADLDEVGAARNSSAAKRVTQPVGADFSDPDVGACSSGDVAHPVRSQRLDRRLRRQNTRRLTVAGRIRVSTCSTPRRHRGAAAAGPDGGPCRARRVPRPANRCLRARAWATSAERNPSRATSNNTATSREPIDVDRSQLAISRSTSSSRDPRRDRRSPCHPATGGIATAEWPSRPPLQEQEPKQRRSSATAALAAPSRDPPALGDQEPDHARRR